MLRIPASLRSRRAHLLMFPDVSVSDASNTKRLAVFALWYLACSSPAAGSREVLRRSYGKDNRVLYSATLSQGFDVVSAGTTWQSAGVSTGRTKIGVTALERAWRMKSRGLKTRLKCSLRHR